MRKPELHDVLHDGLIVYRKSPHPWLSRDGSLTRSRSLSQLNDYEPLYEPRRRRASLEYSPRAYDNQSFEWYCGRSRQPRRQRPRARSYRSLSPAVVSLNRDLERENYRSPSIRSSRSRSVSPVLAHNTTYDVHSLSQFL